MLGPSLAARDTLDTYGSADDTILPIITSRTAGHSSRVVGGVA